MHTFARAAAFGVLGLTFGLQPTTSSLAASAAPRHTLWSLPGKSNTVYLLGSVHFLSPEENSLTK